jgi:predicted ATPase
LLERDAEIAGIERMLGEGRIGTGRVTVIEGPAGIGKSELLEIARRRALG